MWFTCATMPRSSFLRGGHDGTPQNSRKFLVLRMYVCPRDLSCSYTRESACFLRLVPHACTTDKLLLTSWVASVNNDQQKKRSGSTYAYSVLDEGYREGMSLQEAAALARRAVRHATYRDAFSGKLVRWFAVFSSWSTSIDCTPPTALVGYLFTIFKLC